MTHIRRYAIGQIFPDPVAPLCIEFYAPVVDLSEVRKITARLIRQGHRRQDVTRGAVIERK